MPYPPTPDANQQRDAITQALMNVQNPPPRTEMPPGMPPGGPRMLAGAGAQPPGPPAPAPGAQPMGGAPMGMPGLPPGGMPQPGGMPSPALMNPAALPQPPLGQMPGQQVPLPGQPRPY